MNELKKCPQCKHIIHFPLVETVITRDNEGNTIECSYEGGCNQVVYIKFDSIKNYHEHCDCDYQKDI